MARRKIPPFPLHDLEQNPRIRALPAAAFGMLLRLLFHYWMTECRPLPTTDNALYILARAHKPTWYSHRLEIKEILADVLPDLERSWVCHKIKVGALKDMRDRARAVSDARRLAKKAALAGDLFDGVVAPKRDQANKAATIVTPAPKPGGKGFKDKAA